MIEKENICIIGLGYVGLPLAVLFAKKYKVIGYDSDKERITSLKNCHDKTNEVSSTELHEVIDKSLQLTSNSKDIANSNIFIITVPTPIYENKQPNLEYLISATSTVAKFLKKGDLVIYESTVFPGCTEEICVPILSKDSNLKYNIDFHCGYSPERVNPGDKVHTIEKIIKVVSASNSESLKTISKLYSSVVKAGVYEAESIKVAEAAKVIENSQRDINIAFINELALIFNLMDIDTNEVLKAASTKWNFLNFKPGLVGGHCIGVDPYYLSSKSNQLGYTPEIILAGRKINDYMPKHIANKVNQLVKNNSENREILILGASFKENCPDYRNSKAIDLYNYLKEYGYNVEIYDPYINKKDFFMTYNFNLVDKPKGPYDGIILAVAHEEFKELNFNLLKRDKISIVYDVKGVVSKNLITDRL